MLHVRIEACFFVLTAVLCSVGCMKRRRYIRGVSATDNGDILRSEFPK